MVLTREQKEKIVNDLQESFASQKSMVFIGFSGLEMKEFQGLRKELKNQDSKLIVAKKTLMRLASEKAGLKINFRDIEGQLALVFGFKDELSVAKAVYDFSKTSPNLKILGGFFDNSLRGKDEIIALAQLPSKDMLLANMVGSIKAPISNFVGVLSGNMRNLVYVLSAIKK